MAFTKSEISYMVLHGLMDFSGICVETGHDRSTKGLMATMEERAIAAPILFDEGVERFIIDPFNSKNIDIVSLDFVVGGEIFEYDCLYENISPSRLRDLALEGKAKKHLLEEGQQFTFSPKKPGKPKTYYVLSKERIRIPNDLNIFIDSKSTIGRLACLCQNAMYVDDLKIAQQEVVAIVRPYFFPITITTGISKLFQGVFNKGSHLTRDQLLSSKEIMVEINGKKVALENVVQEDELVLTYSTKRYYVSKKGKKFDPINVDLKDANWQDYFEEREGKNGEIVMSPDRFYLLGTREVVGFGGVCGRIERAPGGSSSGLWGQFAGIIQPGFQGSLTMECREKDSKRIITEGTLAGRVKIDSLVGDYRLEEAQGSYCGQDAPKLPKVFKID